MTGEIELIKQKLRIEDVVGKYVKSLSGSGRNLKGLCPFHQEKTPSFMVNPELGIFKCFGCGEGGDVISFLQKVERLEFSEALALAAEMAGITIKQDSIKKDKVQQEKNKRVKELNASASKYFHYLLTEHPSGKAALAYTRKRGIDDKTIKEFELGYAPPGNNLVSFLRKKGYSDSELVDYGLAIERSGKLIDKFRERLVFPISDIRGAIVGFSARTLVPDGIPKFLNSPETPIYHKSEVLYGFYQGKEWIRKAGFVVLFEGNVDIMNSHRLGVKNVACPLGTALTQAQLTLIKRYCEKVYFCFDTDAAGFKALTRAVGLAEQMGIEHRAINLGSYHDADDLMMANPAKWLEVVSTAENSISYILKTLATQIDLATPEGKIEFRRKALPVLKLVKDPIEINHFVAYVAKLIGVTDDVVKASLEGGLAKSSLVPPMQRQLAVPALEPVPSYEKAMLAIALNYVRGSNGDLLPEYFSSATAREIFVLLQQKVELSQMQSQLSQAAQNLLIEVATQSVPTDIATAYNRVRSRLKHGYLKREAIKLQKRLDAMPDDEEAISQLAQITAELSKINKRNANKVRV